MSVKITPYGSWKSPITSEMIVTKSIKLGQIALDGSDIYWLEMRPEEKGRNVIVRRTRDEKTMDMNPVPFDARTRVHEYGGGAFVVHNGTVFFSNFKDQRIYRQTTETEPHPVTPDCDYRYADGVLDIQRNRLVCIREDHSKHDQEAVNTIVSLNLDGDDSGKIQVEGNDFYASPRLSPDGSKLTWLTWNHPNMPWDGTELWIGNLNDAGTIGDAHKVAGGIEESIFQPEWSPGGELYFISDKTGWWNLYRLNDGAIEAIIEKSAEFGLPQWIFGMSTYAFISNEELVCTYFDAGQWKLARVNIKSKKVQSIHTPFSYIEEIRASSDFAVFKAGSATLPISLVCLDLRNEQFELLHQSTSLSIDSGYISQPQAVEFPTENGLKSHAYFYPPQSKNYNAPKDELPPLIVKSHGGPTASTSTVLEFKIQYWTSRGFAVLDVNYGGSTGYGREYRQRLNGRWGIVDVDDSVNGAQYLVNRGLVDANRIAIVGGSAGGYTTLAALTFRDLFKAGASYYGISDLEAMTKDTHKFESRYLERLVGPYPEKRKVYVERSPIHFTDRLSCPIIVFQGFEDKIVPPNQAEILVDALRKKGLPVAYVLFKDEQHGFRIAENIKRALEAELYFYSKIFNFELADIIEPIQIYNL